MNTRSEPGLWAFLTLLALAGVACGLLSNTEPTTEPTATAQPPVTASPTATAEAEFTFTDYRDVELGLSLRYPEGWAREQEPGSLIVASEPELLTSDRFESEGAGVIIIVAARADLQGETLEAAFADALERFELAGEGVYVERPRNTTIGGQDAVTATLEQPGEEGDGKRLVYRVALFQVRDRVALVTGVTLKQVEGRFAPALETIIDSVQLGAAETIDVPQPQGALEYGQTVRGTIAAGDASAWSFIGVEGETIDISVRPLAEGLDVTVDVVDAAHTSVLESGTVDEAFGTETIRGLTLPASDEYTILVRGFGRSSGDYELHVAESGATGTALSLSVGESMQGSLETNEQDDYALLSSDGAPITIVVEPQGELDVVVELLGPDNTVIVQQDSSYGQEQLPFTPEAGTEYQVRVRGFAGAGGDYLIAVQEGAVAPGAGTMITASDSLTGGAEDGHDFPFHAAQGDVVQAIVQPEGDLDVVVEVWNDGTDELEESFDESFGLEEATFTAAEAGNYFFKVLGFEGQTGSYTIELIGPPTTVFELAIGDQVRADFGQALSIDYHLRMDPGETVAIRAQPDSETDVTLKVLDARGSTLAALDDGFRGEVEVLSYTAPADSAEREVYTIRVSNYFDEGGGSFSLLLQEG